VLADYPEVVEIHNAIYPNLTLTVEAMADQDRQRDPKYRYQRWVAIEDDRIAGFGLYGQQVFDYHPRKFHVSVAVLPEYRRRGIGSALYDQVMAGLLPFGPRKLRADGYGDLMEGVRFLQRRGFEEVFRETPLNLDVMAFDPGPYTGLEAKLRAEGIEIKALSELEGDVDRDRRVYDLFWEATRDVPQENPVSQMPFPEWVEWTLQDPSVPHDGYFVAVHTGEYVGICEFGINRADNTLQAGLAGVKRAFRGQGIALAMHLRAIAYARRKGHTRNKTGTAVGNVAMRALYDRLGFIAQPDWIQLEKTCQTGGGVLIREATMEDSAGLARVQVDSYRTSYAGLMPRAVLDGFTYEEQEQDWRDWISSQPEDLLYVAEAATGEIVGYALARPGPIAAPPFDSELVALHVRRAHQRQGLGRRLMATVAEQLGLQDCKSLMLWILEENPARGFYEHLGGQLLDERKMSSASVHEVAYGWPTIESLCDWGSSMKVD
jgi:GNAT superfamily N-acetyltransferase